MEIVNIKSGKGVERCLNDQMGIALTHNIADLEDFTASDVQIEGFVMAYIEEGKAQFNIGGEECRTESGEIILINNGQQISDIMVSSKMIFCAFFLNPEFMLSLASRLTLNWSLRTDMMQFKFMKIKINEHEARNIRLYYDLLDSKRQQTRHQQEGIDALCRAFGYEMLDLMERHEIIARGEQREQVCDHSAMQLHFNKFMELLVERQEIEHKVNWYATQLCITPKYLNMICQKLAQKSPSTIIDEEITQRALRLLRESQYSIKQISQQLGFNNQSHFGTFMRHSIGKSPQQIRQK